MLLNHNLRIMIDCLRKKKQPRPVIPTTTTITIHLNTIKAATEDILYG
jgi:hypothetical protein